MLYIEFHERGKYPLLIEAKKLVKGDIKRNIRRTFEEQYECDDNIFENYCQFDNKNKVLFIDNLQDYTYNSLTLINVLSDKSV